MKIREVLIGEDDGCLKNYTNITSEGSMQQNALL